jgi:DNA-binding MarR family transcriptional regulator
MSKKLSYYLNDCLLLFRNNFVDGFYPLIKMNLNKTEIKTLFLIKIREGLPMSYYSNIIGVENGSFTTIIDNIEEQGLVQRTEDPKDKRKKVLFLTEKGKNISRKIINQYDEFYEKRFSILNEDQKTELIQALETIDVYKKVYER